MLLPSWWFIKECTADLYRPIVAIGLVCAPCTCAGAVGTNGGAAFDASTPAIDASAVTVDGSTFSENTGAVDLCIGTANSNAGTAKVSAGAAKASSGNCCVRGGTVNGNAGAVVEEPIAGAANASAGDVYATTADDASVADFWPLLMFFTRFAGDKVGGTTTASSGAGTSCAPVFCS